VKFQLELVLEHKVELYLLELRENNYMGKGLSVDTRATLTEETFKGKFSVTNPNFKNSDKSVFLSFEALENDQLKILDTKQIKLVLKLVPDLNI
jgi:outer membrane protein insertion porin family